MKNYFEVHDKKVKLAVLMNSLPLMKIKNTIALKKLVIKNSLFSVFLIWREELVKHIEALNLLNNCEIIYVNSKWNVNLFMLTPKFGDVITCEEYFLFVYLKFTYFF